MSEVDEVKTGKETSDLLMSQVNDEGEKIGKEVCDTSLMSEENEEGNEGTGNATFDPLLALQHAFEGITLTLTGGKTTFSELIHQTKNEMDERAHHDLGECSTHEKNGKSILRDDAVERSSTAEDLDTLKDDSESMDNMDSENKKEMIPDSRSLIDVITEMQGKENRNTEWFLKAERRMEEKIKKMNLRGELRYIDAENAEEKDIKKKEKKGVTELTKEWDTNKEAESGNECKGDDTSVWYPNQGDDTSVWYQSQGDDTSVWYQYQGDDTSVWYQNQGDDTSVWYPNQGDDTFVLYPNQGDDKNAETQQSAELAKEREKNGGINQWSEEQLEREIDREVENMYTVYQNLNKAKHRKYYLHEYGGHAEKIKLGCIHNKKAVEMQYSILTNFKKIKKKWEMEELYWETTCQVTLEKIRDYSLRLEELKKRGNIEDLSNETKPGKPSQKGSSERLENLKYWSCAKKMSVRKSNPFQESEKEVHSNDERMENNLNEEIFLVLSPYNILEGDDVNEHVKNGIIIQLIDFGYNVYERIKNELSRILIKPIFLVYTNIKTDTLHIFPPETKWLGKMGIIRIDKRETERIEEFKSRKPKPISYLNLDVTKFLCIIKKEVFFSSNVPHCYRFLN
ncbi:hypothetical protein TNIN_498291 [Trichonephila inaurata madagascariensis]|uniref:Uncharacterized protein n=1 Tax=Trichonephila inaurata madagascariensis TaxID=2747483 RepID=A0A8X6X999_9ARAC|nr:hypothetical protein TNIN_498291 [Trichonephila inaurata madagascariensis]